ncbi:GNAT family N-acetyltransferase [Pseudofrancisella aestuarii]|uniref:GNAT family N-acetyltransferase n=1 Tax=Pseudofrancisella aestuarii TaxID=2670347 RepID=A0ABV9TC32_9GAMM|nr:GNAT family N-acetyltransferase [Pseudofrancisella aestuarii]
MKEVHKESKIIYSRLDYSRVQEVAELFANLFIQEEYLIKNSKVSYENYILATTVRAKHAATTGLSLIAICENTNKVIGFCINIDPYSEIQVDRSSYASKDPAFEIINSALSGLYNGISFEEKPGVNFSIYALGVSSEFQNKGIASNLFKISEQIAIEKNFSVILTDATSPGTKKIAEKLNYTAINKFSYKDYIYKGKKPFENINDYYGPILFKKIITSS